ncbi:MAG: UDP-N-acetylmuramoyl-L-alanyl-D-glutamate--2,6-diaminopimelate ligase [Halothiobacillaceae bacterium]|jgi:UDP-N-acetylmuramoyl-L-alanyl-D-glutamate--2,6-diaminopimelate ligase|nr:UDP-N-acetylmuramoyl-L-alanyl-D-glutamate--2,6-diaminopimelate ligase [Halothiobacillaceae bacterium]
MMTLRELLYGMGGVGEAPALPVSGLCADSRKLEAGQVFLALPGATHDGRAHVEEALRRGASAVVLDAAAGDLSSTAVPVLRLPALAAKLGLIASRYYGAPSRALRVIGVTGTNGKTSVTHFLAQALSEAVGPTGLIGTLGNGLYGQLTPGTHTTPDALHVQATLAELRDAGARHVAMEVSSHALAQERVAGVEFAAAVFTNLTRDHLDYHGDLAAYGRAKARLFSLEGLGEAIVNMDDPFGRALLEEIGDRVSTWAYGLGDVPWEATHAQRVRGRHLRMTDSGMRLEVHTPLGQGELRSPLLGAFNASNLLAACATLLALGMPLETALACLSDVRPPPGRMQTLGAEGQPRVVVDYAHTPDALAQVLSALRAHLPPEGRLWCVFGCGGERDAGKRPLMGQAAESLADVVLLTDDNPRAEDGDEIVAQILEGMDAPDRARVERDRRCAIEQAVREATVKDIVLIAGKGHETEQRIGARVLPFSDSEVAQEALAGWLGEVSA